MLDKNITMDDIHFAIKNSMKNDVDCVFSDFNSDNLIFRIRLMKQLTNKKKSLDQSDEIHILQNLQENLLDNIILKGVKGIPKIVIRKVINNVSLKDLPYCCPINITVSPSIVPHPPTIARIFNTSVSMAQ